MTAVDHLIAAHVELEQQSIEIKHRQSFIREAIEAFGIDADDALLMAMRAEGDGDLVDSADGSVVHAIGCLRPVDLPSIPAEQANAQFAVVDLTPETVQQDDPHPYKTENGRWDWDVIAAEIEVADDAGERRAKHLAEWVEVSESTAYWMVKRCREMSLIDTERAPANHQAARDAAAAAL